MSWKSIDRRTFLRGGSATLALPLLEAMFPAKALANGGAPVRFLPVLYPYGAVRDRLEPSGSNSNYTFAQPWGALTPYRSHMTYVRGMRNYWGEAHGDGPGDHARGQGTYLTCVRINKSTSDLRSGRSVDHFAADIVGADTRVRQIYMSNRGSSGGDSGYSSEYRKISWLNDRTPDNPILNPAEAFRILFSHLDGNSTNEQLEAEKRRLMLKKSVLDEVMEDAKRIISRVGQTDRLKMEQYLEGVRETEKKYAVLIENQYNGPSCEPGQDPGNNLNFQAQTDVMFRMMAHAIQCDVTRVMPYFLGTTNFSFIGVEGDHHSDFSHHQLNANKVDGLLRINKWYADQYAKFIKLLIDTPDVDGKSLIYNSITTFGSDLRDGDQHDNRFQPIVVAGNAGGRFNPGRLLDTGSEIRLASIWLTILNKGLGGNISSFGEGGGQSNGMVNL